MRFIQCSLIGLFLFFTACGNIQVLNGKREVKDHTHLYTEKFLKALQVAKRELQRGDFLAAQKILNQSFQFDLTGVEQAALTNLKGVVAFSLGKNQEAILQFQTAQQAVASSSPIDPALQAQIQLNLAQTQFRLKDFQSTQKTVESISVESLNDVDLKKYYFLRYQLQQISNQLAASREGELLSLAYLFHWFSFFENYQSVREHPQFIEAQSKFIQLPSADQNTIFQKIRANLGPQRVYVGALLLLKLSQNAFYSQNTDVADDYIEEGNRWLNAANAGMSRDAEPSWVPILRKSFEDLKGRFILTSEYDPEAIGIILPQTGNNQGFSKRSIEGFDFLLKSSELSSKDRSHSQRFKYYFRDSAGSASYAAIYATELISQKKVSAIIGGLSRQEATAIYDVTKQFGVLFISLSPVDVASGQKTPLLIEVPSSVESQLAHLRRPATKSFLGNRLAMLYSLDGFGPHLADQVWNLGREKVYHISRMQSFDVKSKTLIAPVQNLFELNFETERKEEASFMERVYSFEKKGAVRRLQTLPPVIDFDWLYLPVSPQEAGQIFGLLAWLDVQGVKIVGGPNFRAQGVANDTKKYGHVYFLGDDLENTSSQFASAYQEQYKRPPRLLENLGYLAASILLKSADALLTAKNRSDVIENMKLLKEINLPISNWKLQNHLWVKEVALMKIVGGKISPLTL